MPAGLLILISTFSFGYVVYTIIKAKPLKYMWTLIISMVYGFLLFFIGMSVSGAVFWILVTLPVLIGLILIIRRIL
ncbi:putative neutral ceramidase superfamily lipid hydrolase [Thalassobacillus pellis]|nr:putative neutral ceramidase superfamily lipid hydrolase [Thalassobacillus pellis]